MNRYLDLHVLQTVPPSNINRDDTGSPKTAVYGGVRRARVSSQAWKREIRSAFETLLDADLLGDRTRRVVEALAGEITAQAPDLAGEAEGLAVGVWNILKITVAKAKKDDPGPALASYLVFLSHHQLTTLAALAVAAHRAGTKPDARAAKNCMATGHGVEIALFGRMVAERADLNVDACAQVAHAISVHAVDNEYDYFTAMDDRGSEDSAGAGMIGTVEFNSSTLYRYATVNLTQLQATLDDDAVTEQAVRAFVEAFVTSMPTGKQNTFANRTLPDAVLIQIRDGQPVNLVGAFEDPVTAGDGNRIAAAATRLADRSVALDDAFGATPARSWVIAVGAAREPLVRIADEVGLAVLLSEVGGLVAGPAAV